MTLRTAGFNTIDESALHRPLAGGRVRAHADRRLAGSTAGGLKTVTVAVLALSAVSALRGTDVGHGLRTTIEPRAS